MRKRKPNNMNLGFVWAFVALIAITFAIRQIEVIRIQKELTQVKAEIEYYHMLNAALERQAEVLKSKEYVEKAAREKLGLVMPGEVQYIPVKNQEGR